jgi:protein TonB
MGEAPAAAPQAEMEASFEPPRLLYLPTPEYPQMGRRMGREGVVELQVLVDEGGRVRSADPVGERLGMGFEAAARRAAFAARFEPARSDGRPVEAETRIAIRFRLR